MDNPSYIEKRYHSLSDYINVIWVIGYIIDFCIRPFVSNPEMKYVALVPF